MHMLVVTFNLRDMSGDEWAQAEAPRLAPAFAHLSGLISKIWLADESTNTFGGVYMWRDQDALEAFLASDLAAAVRAHPHLTNLSMRSFAVLEDLTRATQPELEVVPTAQPV